MTKKKEKVEVEIVEENEIQTPKKKVNKKKLFTLIGVGALSVALIATTYWAVIKYVLIDYENMAYLNFQYSVSDSDANHVPEVTITGVVESKRYPSNFRVPTKLLGYNVTGIGDYAFAGLDRLKKVSLPNTITTIGTGAFSNCENLTSVKLESKNLTSVGVDIFDGSPKWEGNSQTGIVMFGSLLYRYNGEMQEGTVIKPSEDRIAGEDEATHLYIGDDVTLIASGAFSNQSGLKSVKLPDRFSTISDSLLKDCVNLESFEGDGITTIGNEVFSGCVKLSEFDFEGVTSFGSYAFNDTGIKEVALNESVTFISDGLFKDCSDLTAVSLPNGLSRIGSEAFMNCASLTNIESGTTAAGTIYANSLENVEYIGESAFENSGLVSFTVPKNVISINSGTFRDCSDLASVTFQEVGVITTKDASGNDVKEIDPYGQYAYTGIQTIEAEAFKNTTSLTSLNIPNYKGEYIERVASGMTLVDTPHQNVTVNTLASIGEGAFEGSALQSIIIPASIGEIARNTFRNCTSLATIEFQDPTNTVTVGIFGGGAVVNSARTSDIRTSAFENTTSLTSIALPNSVVAIQSSAFKNSSLASATLPTNPSFNTVAQSLFSGCKNLKQIELPSNVNTIRANAFEYTGLTSITIAQTITQMEGNIFFGCEDLSVINLDFSEDTYNAYLALGVRGWYSNWNVIDASQNTFDNIVFLK